MLKLNEEYKRKLLDPSAVIAQLKDNQLIVVAMAASEPSGLLEALSQGGRSLNNVRVCTCLLMNNYDFLSADFAGHIFTESWFYGAGERGAHDGGNVSHLPNNLHEAGLKKAEKDQIDFFWGTATPMDCHGYFSLSLGVTYEKTMIETSKHVILEINENLPRTLGDTQVHISQIDGLVEHNAPLKELPPTEPSTIDKKIAAFVLDLIEDGATLQLGIGGIPNAIAHFLESKKNLGIHTEMFTDGMVDLYQKGVVNGLCKSLWPGKMVGAFALGSKKLYDFIDNNLGVEFQQGKITNDPYVIGQNHKMISINTALQVDLTGQVVSEWLNGKQFSGTGGQGDTHRGAQRSEGGKGIIALPSTAKKGQISTIVPQLPLGAMITLGRQETDIVVTEYGIAFLKGQSVRERVRRLIAIAHPDFRRELRQQASQYKLW